MDDGAGIEQLLDALNESEQSPSRRGDAIVRHVMSRSRASGSEWHELVDMSRSGALSFGDESYSITLREGTIIGRGLFGDGPLRDLPGAVNSRTWRVWDIRWNGERLRCLRCGHEWESSHALRPEQCPNCLGILDGPEDGSGSTAPERPNEHELRG